VNEALKEEIRRYWEARPCGSDHARAEPGSAAFFAEIEAARDRLEPFIGSFAEFERWRARRVLEVGIGVGTDFLRFVRAGAVASGIDVTHASVELVRKRVALEHLDADVRVGDAEALPYPDGMFELVYSWGVLHHTPNIEAALAEVRRVLVRRGEARVMLYSRRSWFALGVWLRYALGRGRPWRSLTHAIANHLESAGTRAFTQRELEELFADFRDVRFVRFVTPYDRRVAGPLTRLGGNRFGWFVGVVARS
jgi:ubiquinone/menaquinone biosynthesis C-methylase UbiE